MSDCERRSNLRYMDCLMNFETWKALHNMTFCAARKIFESFGQDADPRRQKAAKAESDVANETYEEWGSPSNVLFEFEPQTFDQLFKKPPKTESVSCFF